MINKYSDFIIESIVNDLIDDAVKGEFTITEDYLSVINLFEKEVYNKILFSSLTFFLVRALSKLSISLSLSFFFKNLFIERILNFGIEKL